MLEAARLILSNAPIHSRKPQVAYLPAASLHHTWTEETRQFFRDLAEVAVIDVAHHSFEHILSTLDHSDLLYIPGGNTYWLAHRLNSACRGLAPGSWTASAFDNTGDPETQALEGMDSRLEDLAALVDSNPLAEMGGEDSLMAELRRRARGGLPVIGFSAGAVLCGPDILTTNDINASGCTCFSGLGLVPFHINVHYPTDPQAALARQERLQEFLHFHPRATILALEDSAYVRATQGEVHVLRGGVWKIERDKEAQQVFG